MTRNIWVGIVVVFVLVAGGFWYLNQSNVPATPETTQFPTTQSTPQNTTSGTQPVVNNQNSQPTQMNTQTQTAPSGLQTFKSENGFQFQYPAAWKATGSEQAGASYQLLARVVNPARAGKPDTDVPIEQFLVRRMDGACRQESAITFAGKAAYDSGWTASGMDPSMLYRSVCVQVSGWPIHIDGSAADQTSKSAMDAVFASFVFTQ